MTSSPSPFATNTGKLQVLPSPTTLLFTQSINNNVNLNNMGSSNNQNMRQTSLQNGTILQQPMTSGLMTTPTSIVRVNQPQNMQQHPHTISQGQYVPQTIWTNNISQTSQQQQQQFTLQKQTHQQATVQYTTVKNGKIKYFSYKTIFTSRREYLTLLEQQQSRISFFTRILEEKLPID
ncbi:unnamed protein product [Rotaria magnacalcarata]|uniref:Uncharacterized protein n=1 Tax=Rotaria magnacalcarata TaxID=392030 RepID=A0A8S3GTC8_9BILA|nr:unnamed protein product [Rotaria magnacalcarata]